VTSVDNVKHDKKTRKDRDTRQEDVPETTTQARQGWLDKQTKDAHCTWKKKDKNAKRDKKDGNK
jgi:hypothetical protein